MGTCKVPRAAESLKEELSELEETSDQFSRYIVVLCVLRLDNVQENVEIAYYLDPTINDFTESDHVVKLEADDRHLKITVRIPYNISILILFFYWNQL